MSIKKAISNMRLFKIYETNNLPYSGFMICSILLVSILLLVDVNDAFAANIDLTATTVDEYHVSLSWVVPPGDYSGNKAIEFFEIRYKETTDTDFLVYVTGLDSDTRGLIVGGLKKGTSYDFRVRAEQVTGGMNSNLAHATTPKTDPTPWSSPPKISGIGIYKITLTGSLDNPYLDSGSYTRKLNTRFEDFFPYSKASDKSDFKNYGNRVNYEKSGQYFYTDEYSTSTPTVFGEVNQPIQIQARLTTADDIAKVSHLSFYTDVRDTRSDKQFSNAYVIFDKGKTPYIFDPNGLFKSVNANSSIENGQFWVILDFVFAKPMKKSDIILESWAEGSQPTSKKIINAWEISAPKQVDQTIQETIPLDTHVEISHNAASPVCKADNSCFNPSEAKILVGGTVTWINTDSFIHTVTNGVPEKGGDQPHLFDGFLNPGRSYQYTFNTSGKYGYFCEIHPWAIGRVVVFEKQISSTVTPPANPSLIVQSITSGGSLMIENNDAVYLADRSLHIEISGHVEGATHGKVVDLLIKRPDKSFEKSKVTTNKQGYYKTVTVLDKKWQSGSYTIVAQYNNKIIGNISFVIMESQ